MPNSATDLGQSSISPSQYNIPGAQWQPQPPPPGTVFSGAPPGGYGAPGTIPTAAIPGGSTYTQPFPTPTFDFQGLGSSIGQRILGFFPGGEQQAPQQAVGVGAAALYDQQNPLPRYPDTSSAYQQILAQGPQTEAGKIAAGRLTEFLNEGPSFTPVSEDFINSLDELFDNNLDKELAKLDTGLQAAGAGRSGDSEVLKGQLINDFTIEKSFYMAQIMHKQMNKDIDRYYRTLRDVYGISNDELQQMASLEVSDLAAQFQIDLAEAEELKEALGQVLQQATSPLDVPQSIGQRILKSLNMDSILNPDQAFLTGILGGV